MKRIINIGELCRNWRLRNNITVHQIALDLNMHDSTIYKFESMNRSSFVILSWYIDHGFDMTFEYTRDLWIDENCDVYVSENED